MAIYDDNDTVTYYFVVNNDGRHTQIQGWTDNKDLAKFYMNFHNCKHFSLKSMTKPLKEIIPILEENNNDEIVVRNIVIKDPNKKGKRKKYVAIPTTNTESMMINEECNTLLSSEINYSFIDSAIPYMKKKYRDIFDRILLTDAIKVAVHNQRSKAMEMIELDQMMILLRMYPDNFNK